MCRGKLAPFTHIYKCVFDLMRSFKMEVVDRGRP